MITAAISAGVAGSLAWLVAWLVPIRLFAVGEVLAAGPANPAADLSDITAIIPARNELQTLGATLDALARQGSSLRVIVVDDQSSDGTGDLARFHAINPTVIRGSPPPSGWLGKVWALEQAFQQVNTPYLLLVDADISLQPGVLISLRQKLATDELTLISLMAELRTESFWERLLAPAYVYFFRLLYPFTLVRSRHSRVAAAAGGCVLLCSAALTQAGGFAAIRGAIIDDCSLARILKEAGFPISIGLTHDVMSLRPYDHLADFWSLVSRSAFAELNFSLLRLLACSVAMLALFVGPLILAASSPSRFAGLIGVVGLAAMFASYVPILRFYGLGPLRCATLPAVAAGYLLMTWHSAIRYWNGTRTVWKGRAYSARQGWVP